LASLLQHSEEDDRIGVVATFYPLAYLAESIGGERISVKTLIPQNNDVHSWEPSTADMIEVDKADIVVYNGAGLEPWFEDDILPALDTEGKLIVDTTAGLELIPSGGDGSYDPHTWLSPYMAKLQAERIHDALASADPGNASYFGERWAQLSSRLEALDESYLGLLSAEDKSDIFVGHSAYGYLAQRYGFEQHGIIGLAADESPSATTIASLVDLMVEYDIYVVYVDPLYREDYAESLRRSLEAKSGQTVEVLSLYLLVGVADGLDMMAQMEANLENLAAGVEARQAG
ncbi:MAG: zinc ABC transporter substrate-binding protein, partial [Candidatus Thermoplasmatota archaeon]|nr:zinc ABC transporter substrate-binding protein [Candidatus Thermoplasmatota archaeon]